LVLGLGRHGLAIASGVVAAGYQLVAAVEVDSRVGSPLAEVVEGAHGDDLVLGDLALGLKTEPDVVVVAAALPPEDFSRTVLTCIERGVNVISISAEAFDTNQEWLSRIDEVGRKTGATLLTTGVQDVWWVQMPALAAAVAGNVTSVRIEHVVDLNTIAPEVGGFMGVGAEPGDGGGGVRFPYQPGQPPVVLGAALNELARRLGLSVIGAEIELAPVIVSEGSSMRWIAGDSLLPAGAVAGMEERSFVNTAEGVVVEGVLRTSVLGVGERPSNRVVIEGNSRIVLDHPDFDGESLTNAAVLARIADVVAARGGVLAPGSTPGCQPASALRQTSES